MCLLCFMYMLVCIACRYVCMLGVYVCWGSYAGSFAGGRLSLAHIHIDIP